MRPNRIIVKGNRSAYGHCPRASGARLRRTNTEHIRPSGPRCGPSQSTHSERHREEKDLGFKSLWNSEIQRRADLDIRSLSKARHRQSRNCLTQSASCTFCVRFYTNLCAIPNVLPSLSTAEPRRSPRKSLRLARHDVGAGIRADFKNLHRLVGITWRRAQPTEEVREANRVSAACRQNNRASSAPLETDRTIQCRRPSSRKTRNEAPNRSTLLRIL
jgi:hypothetical protein